MQKARTQAFAKIPSFLQLNFIVSDGFFEIPDIMWFINQTCYVLEVVT